MRNNPLRSVTKRVSSTSFADKPNNDRSQILPDIFNKNQAMDGSKPS
jgi:hypothetical protein